MRKNKKKNDNTDFSQAIEVLCLRLERARAYRSEFFLYRSVRARTMTFCVQCTRIINDRMKI